MLTKPGFRARRAGAAALLAVAFPLSLGEALDFNPAFVETTVEGGFKNHEVVLQDGNARVVYCPPVGWQAEPGPRWLRFHPPGVSLADLTIEADKAAAGRTVDATTVERCREWLKASVPRESSNVVMEADEANTGSVAGCPTFGTTVAFSDGGVRYRKRVIFVFAPDSDIRFITVARVADFDRLYPAVRRSLFTWRWERLR
jgi:hypothetical protein